MKKNWKSCPENWKIRKKLKVLFSMGINFVMDMHNSFFVLFVIVVKKFSLIITRELFFCRSKYDISMRILLPINLTKKTASEKITSP
jgi:hypothetical protein